MHRRAALLSLALLAAACRSPDGVVGAEESPGTPDGASARAGALSASLSVTPSEVRPGDAFSARFTLTNTSVAPVRLTLGCPSPMMMSVRSAAGASVDGALDLPSGCLGVIAYLTLAAGASQDVDMSGHAVLLTYPPLARSPLAAGTYTIVAAPTVIEVDGQSTRLPELTRPLVVR